MPDPKAIRADLPGLACGTIVAAVFLTLYAFGFWGGAQVPGAASASVDAPSTIGATP